MEYMYDDVVGNVGSDYKTSHVITLHLIRHGYAEHNQGVATSSQNLIFLYIFLYKNMFFGRTNKIM